ncbi:MAG: S26 family signal peptidase, partial [Planctomycetota bacterium]
QKSATLKILDGDQERSFSDGEGNDAANVTAPLSIGGSFDIRMSNFDDHLLVWIDDELLSFDGPTTFDPRQFRKASESGPQTKPGIHPLDASPVGIAVKGGSATIDHVRIDRDKYYIACEGQQMNDYDLSELYALNAGPGDVQQILESPSDWERYPVWKARRKIKFELAEDQFFPMGDNSPESLDARCWAGARPRQRLPRRFADDAYTFADASYVPRDLLVGKALMVFWPHPWNKPLPMTPNFSRFRLIR